MPNTNNLLQNSQAITAAKIESLASSIWKVNPPKFPTQQYSYTNPDNVTVNVVEEQGVLTLGDEDIALELGVFAFMSANVRHSLKVMTDLSFLLTLSEIVTDSSCWPSLEGITSLYLTTL